MDAFNSDTPTCHLWWIQLKMCFGFQGLSEAKMEMRRKEHALRQASKQMSYIESEKNALIERVNDAEKTMTAAARLVNKTVNETN